MSYNSNATGSGLGYLGGSNYLTSSARIEMFEKGMIDYSQGGIARFGDENQGIMELINAFSGGSRPVFSYKYGHSELDWMRKAITIQTGLTGAASGNITLAAADSYSVPTSATATFYKNYSTSAAIPVRVNDIIETQTGQKVKVTAVNNSTRVVAIQSLDGANIDIAASDVLPVITNAYAEGTGHQTALDRDTLQYENFVQIVKDQYTVTGTQMGMKQFVKFGDKEFWYLVGMEDTIRRHRFHKEGALLTGVKIDVTNTPSLNDTATTEGLIPFMETYGNIQDYSGSIALADFDAGLLKLTKFRGSNELALVMSQSRMLEIEDMLRSLGGLQNGGINYGMSASLINLGFKGFERGRYKLNLNTLAAFDDPIGLGLIQKYQDIILALPLGTTTVSDYGAQGAETRNLISMVYQQVANEVNGYWEGVEGGVGEAKTNLEDKITIGMRSRIGFEGHCPNKFLLFQKA